MKRIGLFVAILLSFTATHAQTWSKVNGRWQYQFFKTDSTFTPPQDTLFIAPIGSIAVKNDVAYFKNTGGHWVSLVGLSVNLATAPLTANGNYTHNWNAKQFYVDSASKFYMIARGVLINKTSTQLSFEPSSTFPIILRYGASNAAGTTDTASSNIIFLADGITMNANNGTANSNIQVRATSPTGKSGILLRADTVRALLIPQTTGDTILVTGPFDPLTKTNPLYKRPFPVSFSPNIANASLTATSDYTQNWNHYWLRFDSVDQWRFDSKEIDQVFGTRKVHHVFATTANYTAQPMNLYTAIRNVADNADTVITGFRNYFSGIDHYTGLIAANASDAGVVQVGAFSVGNFVTHGGNTGVISIDTSKAVVAARDSATITAPGIRLYNTAGDIKYSTGAGITPYATWKNAGRLLIGTTTDNGFSKLQLNAALADFQSVQRIDVTGSSTFANPIGLSISETSTDGGYGLQTFSTNGYGVAAGGKYFGVSGTVQANAEGLIDAGGVVGSSFSNTTAPALLGKVYGVSGTPNQITPGIDIWRMPNGFPTGGGIKMMRSFLPVYVPAISAVPGTPVLANTITSEITNINGPNYTTDMYFSGPKDSIYSTILTLKGGGQIQGNQYTGSNFETIDTSMPAAVFGTDGKLYRRRGDAGGGTGVTPTWQQTLAATGGHTLTTNHTIVSDGHDLDWHATSDGFGVYHHHNGYSDGFYEILGKSADASTDSFGLHITLEEGAAMLGAWQTNEYGYFSAAVGDIRQFYHTPNSETTTNVDGNQIQLFTNHSSTVSNHTINVFGDSIIIRGDTNQIARNRLRLYLQGLPRSSSTTDSVLVVDATNKVYKRAQSDIVPAKVKFVQTATVSVIANDNELTLVGTGTGSVTIPANTMAVGKNYRVTIRGTYGTDASNPAQQNWRFYLGGTAILVSGNAGLGTNKVDKIFTMGVDITCRTTGSSGTVMAAGMFNTEDGPGAKGFPPTTTTVNTTTNLTFDFTTDLTDGSSGNNMKVYTLVFEEL